MSRNLVTITNSGQIDSSSSARAVAMGPLMAQVITQPHESPDLTRYGFYLFPKFEDRLRGRQFSSDEEEKRFVQVWLRVLPANFFRDDLAKVLRRWQTFLGRDGGNME